MITRGRFSVYSIRSQTSQEGKISAKTTNKLPSSRTENPPRTSHKQYCPYTQQLHYENKRFYPSGRSFEGSVQGLIKVLPSERISCRTALGRSFEECISQKIGEHPTMPPNQLRDGAVKQQLLKEAYKVLNDSNMLS